MKRFCLILVTAAIAIGCIKEDKKTDLMVGDGLPEFKVTMNDGRVVRSGDLKGEVSIVMFFHTTCPDCQKTLPVMQKIYDEYLPKGVKFALVSREEEESTISAFWKEKGLSMPYSAQKDRVVYEKFAQSRIPRIYINDKDGIIRYIYTDNPVPAYEDLKSSVEDSL